MTTFATKLARVFHVKRKKRNFGSGQAKGSREEEKERILPVERGHSASSLCVEDAKSRSSSSTAAPSARSGRSALGGRHKPHEVPEAPEGRRITSFDGTSGHRTVDAMGCIASKPKTLDDREESRRLGDRRNWHDDDNDGPQRINEAVGEEERERRRQLQAEAAAKRLQELEERGGVSQSRAQKLQNQKRGDSGFAKTKASADVESYRAMLD